LTELSLNISWLFSLFCRDVSACCAYLDQNLAYLFTVHLNHSARESNKMLPFVTQAKMPKLKWLDCCNKKLKFLQVEAQALLPKIQMAFKTGTIQGPVRNRPVKL
jgi:hypothetical protein